MLKVRAAARSRNFSRTLHQKEPIHVLHSSSVLLSALLAAGWLSFDFSVVLNPGLRHV